MAQKDNDFVPNQPTAQSISIAAQNDIFRQTFNPALGKVVLTQSVTGLTQSAINFIIQAVRNYTDFKQDGNDNYCEHDFGTVSLDGNKYFWKIDYYDKAMKYGSENPADPEMTTRVMTIMAASDY